MERIKESHNSKLRDHLIGGMPVPGECMPTLKARRVLEKKAKKDPKTQKPKKLLSLLREKKARCGNTKERGREIGIGRSGGQQRSTGFYD